MQVLGQEALDRAEMRKMERAHRETGKETQGESLHRDVHTSSLSIFP